MTQSPPQHPKNALSNSPAGDSYTGFGCFPIGYHTTSEDFNELVEICRRLRTRKILQHISPSNFDSIRVHLAPLQAAQCFWAHHSRDALQRHAVHELLEMLSEKSDNLQLFVFPDSARLTTTTPNVWGLYDLDISTRTTYLYISGKQKDLAGAVLHTFMSSRHISRLQCFLAEYVLADQTERLTEDWELPERLQDDVKLLTRSELQELSQRLENERNLEAPVLLAKLAGLCEELLEKKGEPIGWVEEAKM